MTRQDMGAIQRHFAMISNVVKRRTPSISGDWDVKSRFSGHNLILAETRPFHSYRESA